MSLFFGGLKLRLPLRDPAWRAVFLLAGPLMLVTIVAVAAFAHLVFELPLPSALVLGAVLAPTDPVLASAVSVNNAADHDRVRFGLSGEAGLNDGMAFPFLVFALAGLHVREPAIGCSDGRCIGCSGQCRPHSYSDTGSAESPASSRSRCEPQSRHARAERFPRARPDRARLCRRAGYFGLGVPRGVRRRRRLAARRVRRGAAYAASRARRKERGVPSAGRNARRRQRRARGATASGGGGWAVVFETISFGDTAERLLEVLLVVLLGASLHAFDMRAFPLALVLFVIIRPGLTLAVLAGTPTTLPQRLLFGWFGIRGIGSIYYLCYALSHGVSGAAAQELAAIVLPVLALSVLLHGATAQPILARYERSLARASTQ